MDPRLNLRKAMNAGYESFIRAKFGNDESGVDGGQSGLAMGRADGFGEGMIDVKVKSKVTNKRSSDSRR